MTEPGPDQPDYGYGSEHRARSPLRDWRLKAAAQTVIGRLPMAERLNYLLQRHVTRTLPVSDAELQGQVAKARRNVEAFRRHMDRPLDDAHLYEFGVGWDLLMPIAYRALGVGRQTVVDLRPLARLDLVGDVARRLSAEPHLAGLPGVDPAARTVEEAARAWGIDYRAPADARSIDLPDGSVDMATSCDVLEHVPPDEIRAILRECRRLLRDDGIMRIRIDYQDHYWYFDGSISPYNFLRFDETAWRRRNPWLHYQNRLRHDGLLALLVEAGWNVVEDDHPQPTSDDLAALRALPLAEEFRDMRPERLAIRFANLTLKKVDASEPR